MARLHGRLSFDSVICHPTDVPAVQSRAVQDATIKVFRSFRDVSYAGSSNAGWPRGPNIAWQSTAKHMAKGDDPWLWLESDAIPIKPDWLAQLQMAYDKSGKAFMGPIVPGMGHCNGVAIYPSDTATRCPKAMAANRHAWDYVMRDEMIQDCHDASDLIFHFWGLVNGMPHPTTGNPPNFASFNDVKRWIPESAVLVHRVKDGSLIKQLDARLNLDRKLAARSPVA